MEISGRAAMVTGATGELGRAVVRGYLEAGMHVAIPVRDAAKGEALREEMIRLTGETAGAAVMVIDAHPDDRAAMDGAVERVMTSWGRLDALANLAGGYDRADPWDIDAIQRSWDANVRTAVTATAACLRPMRARRYGRIVSVGSFAADRGGKDTAAYAMSKTAVVRWTESLAAALKDEGITANAILPSIIDHPVNRRQMPNADPTRWVRPDEIAALIVFLTSPDASGVTGAAIPVLGRV